MKLAQEMSEGREQAKAGLLEKLLQTHSRLIAFDSHLITLHHLEQLLHKRLQGKQIKPKIVVAVGSDKASRKELKELMHLNSEQLGIALCSDSMSEGLNLQGASAAIHLDMPSVVRSAEQRVGRIDRMDNPHKTIASFWPKDSQEFALKTDERFYARLELVGELLGSNIDLQPPNRKALVTPQEIIDELEHPEKSKTPLELQQISDAFEPIRDLISGETSLVLDEIYQQVRFSKVSLYSCVSAVYSTRPWAFLAIGATEWHAPHWVYFDSLQAKPLTNLEQTSQHLRKNLQPPDDLQTLGGISRDYDQKAANLLQKFLNRLRETERLLLSLKKQRALDEMEIVLKIYQKKAVAADEIERLKLIENLLQYLNFKNEEGDTDFSEQELEVAVDLGILAECWLDVIRPTWYTRLKERRRGYRPLRLKDIRSDLERQPLSDDRLNSILSHELGIKPLDKRIAAAIVGVP